MGTETGTLAALQDGQVLGELGHSQLARMGFVATDRAARFLADPTLAFLGIDAVRHLAQSPDPDGALIALLRLAESANAAGHGGMLRDLVSDPATSRALGCLLGTSVALGDFLARHPERLREVLTSALPEDPARTYRSRILSAVGADATSPTPVAQAGAEARDALRVEYWSLLAAVARIDSSSATPQAIMDQVSAHLSHLAGAALEGALALARAATPGHEQVRLAVISMGKTGAGELNYISDVDVMYVAEPAREAVGPGTVAAVGSSLAKEVARVCSERTPEGSLWQVDANLRPEGKDGELVRTIDSYRRYYAKWAKSWEFQALLKARPVAGDPQLGEEFVRLTWPLVWQASTREGFVEDTRAMRRRVVSLIPTSQAQHHLKLGPGGLRDVEFTVQLLQMVHGRTDEAIRERGTIHALRLLSDGGYIARDQALELEGAYRTLRVLEHRLQLHRMKRTHTIPTAAAELRRVARSMDIAPEDFTHEIDQVRRRVRQLHEEIYYRPLLNTQASLTSGQITLSTEDQKARLVAIGYADPARAIQHIAALTKGLSRRAAIQRQLLPSFLEWFAQGTDPDLGLLAFRRLSDTLGSTHWFLALLRDSGVAASRLTRILSSSRYVGQMLESFPNAVRWLAHDEELEPRGIEDLHTQIEAITQRSSTNAQVIEALREIRTREILRIALAHVVHVIDQDAVGHALMDLAEVILSAAKDTAMRELAADLGEDPGIDLAIVALGSFGANEMGYSSDADVHFIGIDTGAGEHIGERATLAATRIQRMLNAPAAGMDMKVSADLRPEGKNGPLARSLDSYAEYYASHAESWEKQALLRARVVVASDAARESIEQILDAARYPSDGLTASRRRDFARMKARIESERLPRGAASTHHLKLGRGATTDVEWVVQKLLLENAHAHPALRLTNTREALAALEKEGLLSHSNTQALDSAWALAWELRRALFLMKGRETDVLPTDVSALRALIALLGSTDIHARDLEERYLKLTRRSRVIAEREIFGE